MHHGSAREFEPNHVGLKIICNCESSPVAWQETNKGSCNIFACKFFACVDNELRIRELGHQKTRPQGQVMQEERHYDVTNVYFTYYM